MPSIATAESAIRPVVNVFTATAERAGEVALPAVFKTPIRSDIVHFVHTQMAKNHRQAYAVKSTAGVEVAAESWGPGRAVARVPRAHGSGTGRAASGSYANMCRGGHMFAPNTVLRKWHRKTNVNQKRYAVASALAATAVPAFVMARGHRIANVPELPLVVSTEVESYTKTKEAVALLTAVGAMADVERVDAATGIRAGAGKMRNRRYKSRCGPLVVYNENNGVVRAFANIPGVTVASVNALNLLDLAPGGHMGRFVIFTEAAFKKLDAVFGTTEVAAQLKKGYRLPQNVATTGDLFRLINSQEIQARVSAPKNVRKYNANKKNPLRNKAMMARLCPKAN